MIWNKVVVAYVEVLTWHLLAGAKKLHEKSVSVAQYEEFRHTQ
jgi:hypothetical protein